MQARNLTGQQTNAAASRAGRARDSRTIAQPTASKAAQPSTAQRAQAANVDTGRGNPVAPSTSTRDGATGRTSSASATTRAAQQRQSMDRLSQPRGSRASVDKGWEYPVKQRTSASLDARRCA